MLVAILLSRAIFFGEEEDRPGVEQILCILRVGMIHTVIGTKESLHQMRLYVDRLESSLMAIIITTAIILGHLKHRIENSIANQNHSNCSFLDMLLLLT